MRERYVYLCHGATRIVSSSAVIYSWVSLVGLSGLIIWGHDKRFFGKYFLKNAHFQLRFSFKFHISINLELKNVSK